MYYSGEPIINDSTIGLHLGNDTDRRCGTMARVAPVGSIVGAPATPLKLIPRAEWPDRINDMEKNKSRISDFIVQQGLPVQNQESTLFCWAYSCTAAVMVMRAMQGQPFVKLSPESIAGPVNGYRNAGNMIAEALHQVLQVGVASEEYVPHLAISKRDFKQGWEKDAAKYRAEEFTDLGSPDKQMFDRIMTCLFCRFPVPVNYQWWGHSILVCDPVMKKVGNRITFGNRIWNSWGPEYGAHGFAVVEEPYGNAAEAYALRSIRLGAN